LQQVRNASSDKSNQDPRVKKLMAKIISYNNVPRKEAKFKVGIQYYFMLTLYPIYALPLQIVTFHSLEIL
jgi:hypothetical protein